MRVLIVDDDLVSAARLQAVLEHENYVIECADRGEHVLEILPVHDFDAVVLELRLPDVDGNTLLRRLRGMGIDVPVMIVSCVDDRTSRIQALLDGADDYLLKPVDRQEFLARLAALIRRAKSYVTSSVQIGRLAVDLASRRVTIDGKPLEVTTKEYGILELLALRQGTTSPKKASLDRNAVSDDPSVQQMIDLFIGKILKKQQATSDDHQKHSGASAAFDISSGASGLVGSAEAGAEVETELPAPSAVAPRAAAGWKKNSARRSLSRMLRHMRRSCGLSQTQVAERIGSTQPVIARMESATGPWPSQKAIGAYTKACGHVALIGFLDVGVASEDIAARQKRKRVTADTSGMRQLTYISLGEDEEGKTSSLIAEFGTAFG